MDFVLATEKKWHEKLFRALQEENSGNWHLINRKDDFTFESLTAINPSWVFIPHWSHLIPENIYKKFRCVVFHMTDLPYGRGGSPLQNLIVRGHKETQISAINVDAGIDTGDIYLKRPLSLMGSAEEIFIRSADIIKEMINEIISKNPVPVKQEGEVVAFKRRKPQESNISGLTELNRIYDFIRMLDAEGYPKAYLEFSDFRIEFSRASLKGDESIIADVRIFKK